MCQAGKMCLCVSLFLNTVKHSIRLKHSGLFDLPSAHGNRNHAVSYAGSEVLGLYVMTLDREVAYRDVVEYNVGYVCSLNISARASLCQNFHLFDQLESRTKYSGSRVEQFGQFSAHAVQILPNVYCWGFLFF